jgi:hypothetical protein
MTKSPTSNVAELFEIEVKSWCYGLEKYPGEIYSGLVHAVIKEVSFVFIGAIKHNYPFDILDTASRLSEAAKFLVPEKEIVFSMLGHFPAPNSLTEDQQLVMKRIIDQVDKKFGNAHARLEKRWKSEMEKIPSGS